jgi:hypothetical protein
VYQADAREAGEQDPEGALSPASPARWPRLRQIEGKDDFAARRYGLRATTISSGEAMAAGVWSQSP